MCRCDVDYYIGWRRLKLLLEMRAQKCVQLSCILVSILTQQTCVCVCVCVYVCARASGWVGGSVCARVDMDRQMNRYRYMHARIHRDRHRHRHTQQKQKQKSDTETDTER